MLQIVVVQMGLYKHWALVTDKFHEGKPMLISNTMRNGTVREEPWDQVVGANKYKIHFVRTNIPKKFLLERARSAINNVKYNLLDYNCEHFVNDIISGKANSVQVRSVLTIGGILMFGLVVLATIKSK